MFGAYLELNISNGKMYAGKGEWKKRHRYRELTCFDKCNPWHNSLILRAYRKHGSFSFIPHTLCWFTTEQEAFEQEKVWIRTLGLRNPDKGYNMTQGGDGVVGYKWTSGQRTKLSAVRKKQVHFNVHNLISPESRRKAAAANRKPRSLEARERIRKGNAGKNKGRPSSFKGRLHTPEAKAKNRTAHLKTHCMRGHQLPEFDSLDKRRHCNPCIRLRKETRQKRLSEV